jgi:hypothetical protein
VAFDWRAELRKRPWWANALAAFCAYMTLVYLPYDLFLKPADRDEEVWFGLVLRGTQAKLTEPIHWAIYAAGAYGFLRLPAWIWPASAIYVAQIAIGMLVWSATDERGLGFARGLVPFAAFGALAAFLWFQRGRAAAPR